jgi:IMP dehydrogenase
MVLNVRPSYTFDDVLLVPKFSTIKSRKDVDVSVDLGKGVELGIPIVSANMKNVTGPEMCLKIAELGGLSILHRFFNNPLVDQINIFKSCVEKHKSYENHVGVSIGVQKNDLDFVGIYVDNGIKIICLDIAHGHSQTAIDIITKIKSKYPKVFLIAGNVATPNGFCALAKAGADVVKVNIGAGSSCLTRIETGNGVPQLTALSDCYEAMNHYYPNVKIIADGACKHTADVVKSLCFSNAVMLGNMLAGSDEAPGELINIEGKTYKSYAGSSTLKKENVEGVSGFVPTKGPVENVINKILQGLRSGCSYQGVSNLVDLRKDPQFSLMSSNGLVESRAHDIFHTK